MGADGGRIAPRRDRARVCRDVYVDGECGGGTQAGCEGGRRIACGERQGDDGAAAGRTEPRWEQHYEQAGREVDEDGQCAECGGVEPAGQVREVGCGLLGGAWCCVAYVGRKGLWYQYR